MNEHYREWLENVRDVCVAALNGKQIEEKPRDAGEEKEWWPWPSNTGFNTKCKYRAAQPTINVNGFDVPKPMETKPSNGKTYFIASTSAASFYMIMVWEDDGFDNMYMQRRVVHSSKEAAIKHAKALLGIDPNEEDE